MEILLNPGPVNLSQRVRDALLRPDLCHRESEFSQLQTAIRDKLLDIYQLPQETWAAVLLTGSGTSAMEAMMTSLIPANEKILIIENGVYGERLRKICDIHRIPHESLQHEWTETIDTDNLEKALTGDIGYVALVHHETTTGRLNDIAEVARICRSRNVSLLLDGVSSFGAEEIRFGEWNLAACAATANKCLHGIPGTSFVLCDREALQRTAGQRRTLYLDLETYRLQQDKGATPFTQSVQSFYALDEALNEHKEEGGWQGRRQTYRERMQQAVEGLHELGITSLLADGDSSCVLHSFRLPEGCDYPRLHGGLKQRGFVIYAGQSALARSIFRISLMGAITNDDIQRFLSAVGQVISQ